MIRNIREDSSESCVVVMKAISHCYWADRPQQLLDESAGAQVLLVREPDSVDPNAVRVHFRGQVAGYISSMDARQVAAAMDKAALTSLLGKVVGNATTPYFVLHIACDLIGIGEGTEEDKGLNRVYEEWKYTGPLLPLSKSEKQLQGAVEYLGYVLAGLMPWDGQAPHGRHDHRGSEEVSGFLLGGRRLDRGLPGAAERLRRKQEREPVRGGYVSAVGGTELQVQSEDDSHGNAE